MKVCMHRSSLRCLQGSRSAAVAQAAAAEQDQQMRNSALRSSSGIAHWVGWIIRKSKLHSQRKCGYHVHERLAMTAAQLQSLWPSRADRRPEQAVNDSPSNLGISWYTYSWTILPPENIRMCYNMYRGLIWNKSLPYISAVAIIRMVLYQLTWTKIFFCKVQNGSNNHNMQRLFQIIHRCNRFYPNSSILFKNTLSSPLVHLTSKPYLHILPSTS